MPNAILSEIERILAEGRRAPCHCHAYAFPHRVGGGLCCAAHPVAASGGFHYRGEERDADLQLFDRTEARAINADRSRHAS